jgi:hypothetical protein
VDSPGGVGARAAPRGPGASAAGAREQAVVMRSSASPRTSVAGSG